MNYDCVLAFDDGTCRECRDCGICGAEAFTVNLQCKDGGTCVNAHNERRSWLRI